MGGKNIICWQMDRERDDVGAVGRSHVRQPFGRAGQQLLGRVAEVSCSQPDGGLHPGGGNCRYLIRLLRLLSLIPPVFDSCVGFLIPARFCALAGFLAFWLSARRVTPGSALSFSRRPNHLQPPRSTRQTTLFHHHQHHHHTPTPPHHSPPTHTPVALPLSDITRSLSEIPGLLAHRPNPWESNKQGHPPNQGPLFSPPPPSHGQPPSILRRPRGQHPRRRQLQ